MEAPPAPAPSPAARPGAGGTWPLTAALGPVPALPAAARLLRAFTHLVLTGWGLPDLAEASELIVSEFAANVIRPARPGGKPPPDGEGRPPALWLRLMTDRTRLRIEALDSLPASCGVPAPHAAMPDEESGRGLQIVQALSLGWGWEPLPGRAAKQVWAVLGTQPPEPGNQPACPPAPSWPGAADTRGNLL